MGAIPIIRRSEIQPMYDDMPIMVVNNWTDVTRQSLEAFKSRLNLSSDGVPWRPKIWARYWIERFENDRKNYFNNRKKLE